MNIILGLLLMGLGYILMGIMLSIGFRIGAITCHKVGLVPA